MMVRFVVAGIVISGCSPKAFTPPARPIPLSPAQTPKMGEYDVQVDGNANTVVFGPTLFTGNVRYRHGLSDQLAIVGDVGYARASGGTADHLDPNAGTTRVGSQLSAPVIDEIEAAVFAGVGGGYAPAAGGCAQALAGLDLGPRDRAVVIGLAVAFLHGNDTDVDDAREDVFMGLGGGFHFGD